MNAVKYQNDTIKFKTAFLPDFLERDTGQEGPLMCIHLTATT